jgi:TolB-like protein/Tfp pilus assembly protein PilF
LPNEPGLAGDPVARGNQRAVFLSYASEDADAAQRICAALRDAGIEVWFDQSALRGGDAWDAAIRKQIKTCALFMPVISRNTHARDEGYFRLEWKLAVDRSHLMAVDKAFLLPVVIDDTRDNDDRVPDRFRELQWTRLPGGSTPASFTERVSNLLSPDQHSTPEPRAARGAASGDSVDAGGSGSAPKNQRSSWQSWAMMLIVALIVVAIAWYVIDKKLLSNRAAHPAPPSVPLAASEPPSSPAQAAVAANSIAVLPFLDMSEKKDQEYFSDGLAEELIDQLAKIPGLHVIARTSSFSFKDKSEDIPTIAKQLNVANILEGSVRKAGNRLRVTTQLIRTDSGEDLWSETYDRQLKDVFQVQDEIAGAVVSALKLKLAPGQQAANAHRTSNTEAYNQFLLCKQFAARSKLDEYQRAVAACRKAIELDPGYAAAYAELAVAEALVSDRTVNPALLQQAQATAEKAIAMAPDEADGYAARGFMRRYEWDWTGAQADLEKALALDPGDIRVQTRYGLLLGSLGRLPESIAAMKKATSSDPLSSLAWDGLGGELTYNRQFAAAHEALQRALDIEPDSNYALNSLGTLQLLENNAAQALVTFGQIGDGVFGAAGIAMAEHTLGDPDASKQALDPLIAKYANAAAYQIAEVYAWRGEKARALEWLERAYQQRDGGMSEIKTDPLLDSVRDDARFAALLRKLQLQQ